MISSLIPALTRIFGKVPLTKHYNVAFNTSGVSSGKLLCTLRASVDRPLLVRTRVEVVTAFNAASTNVLTVGTSTTATELLGASDVTEATPGFYPSGAGTGCKRITADTAIYVKYAQTGTAATTGEANVILDVTPLFQGT